MKTKIIAINGHIFEHMETIAAIQGISTNDAITQAFALYLGSQLVSKNDLADFYDKIAKATYLKDRK